MFRCIEYTAFLWKAKGRHGTHSPFAYWLVDHVNCQKPTQINRYFSDIASKKTKNFLNKLLHCLPDYPIFMSVLKQDIPPNNYNGNAPCICILGADLLLTFLEAIHLKSLHPDSILVILEPHKSSHQLVWEGVVSQPTFHFSADCFDFGLLSPRPGQAKEHFYLKLS